MHTYQAVDAALIRATTIPQGLELPPWPDLTFDDLPGWRVWLRQVWGLDGFPDAVKVASPELSAQVERQLRAPGSGPPRRLVETMARYVLRWSTRATPFGLFAGVAPVEYGTRTSLRWGDGHRVVTRPDELFLNEQATLIERRLETLRKVPVVTNCLGFARGRSWVLPCASVGADVADVEVELTAPVRLALESARQPIAFSDLAAELAAEAPEAQPKLIDVMLAELVALGVLLSAIRPPMTVADPAPHLTRYTDLPDPADRVAVDVRIDCSVTLPAAVLREAEAAASTLVAITPEPPGWPDYHQAFLERYGPGAAVPVREVVGETGLGFPAGYRGSSRREPRSLTSRDVALAKVAQQAALDGCAEVILDDDLVSCLNSGSGRPPVPHTELRFSLAAATRDGLERGEFTLTVVSGARHAGVSTGRFLRLLDDLEFERFRRAYTTLPTAAPAALSLQLSGPPLSRRMAAVARVPKLLPVLPIGEYHENVEISLDDLAVTGDAQKLWLVSSARDRPVEPLLFNAVHLPRGQQPLLRFLAEITTAWSAACRPFTWGAAVQRLPFLPRVRRGRSILCPAQWTIASSTLPDRAETWRAWRRAWEIRRETYGIPREAMLGTDDVRIRLDLDEPAHLALLRSHLHRRPEAVLTEVGGRPGWIDGRPHELVIPLARTALPGRPFRTRPVKSVSALTHRPGSSEWLYVKLYGRSEEILVRLAGLVDDGVDSPSHGWWFIRYHKPEPHIRLRIPLNGAARFGSAAARLGRWAECLHADGLLRDYALHPYRPETRFGTGPTLAAAEAVFAADSRTAVQFLSGDRQATTATGMIAIADGFTRDGLRWLVDHVPHRSGLPVPRDKITQAGRPRQDPLLRQALVRYQRLLDRDGLDPDVVLADLLHLHHARMIGVDPVSERYCLKLARAAAQALLARGPS